MASTGGGHPRPSSEGPCLSHPSTHTQGHSSPLDLPFQAILMVLWLPLSLECISFFPCTEGSDSVFPEGTDSRAEEVSLEGETLCLTLQRPPQS